MLTWRTWQVADNTRTAGGAIVLTHYGEGECISSDTKPTEGIHNGSKLFEMDTGKVYMFDGAAKEWLEWSV